MAKRIAIAVVDDDEDARGSLYSVLGAAGYAPRTFAGAQPFLDAFDLAVACVILDFHMPRMNGLELQEIIARRHADLPVVFITAHGDVALAVRALQAGAVDFIEKPFARETVLDSVERALKSGLQSCSDSAKMREAKAMLALLTPREEVVMNLLVNGCSTKMAANELGISPRTVELHRARIMAKTSARNIADVVRTAMTVG